MIENNIKKISAKSGLFNYISKGLMAIVDAATFFMLTKMGA